MERAECCAKTNRHYRTSSLKNKSPPGGVAEADDKKQSTKKLRVYVGRNYGARLFL